MESKKKTAYFQWLRLFAAFAVVLMHTEGSFWPAVDFRTSQWLVLTAWDALVRWPVPVFLMITGALFLPRRTTLKAVLTHYIPRMILAFFFWSGVCVLYGLSRGDREGLLLRFLTGHYHLWYLPFLCGVYLALPFLQKIVTEERLARQLLAVSFAVGIAIPWLGDLAILCRPDWSGVVGSVKNSLHFTFFFDLLAVLLLGHELHRRALTGKQRHLLYLAGILGAALTFPLTLWASHRAGTQSTLFCQITAPTTLCAAAALFVFAKYNLTRLPKLAAALADCSFGIYLVHAPILDFLADRGIHALAGNPVWTVPALAAAVFALSWAVTAIFRRIPLAGKYLM